MFSAVQLNVPDLGLLVEREDEYSPGCYKDMTGGQVWRPLPNQRVSLMGGQGSGRSMAHKTQTGVWVTTPKGVSASNQLRGQLTRWRQVGTEERTLRATGGGFGQTKCDLLEPQGVSLGLKAAVERQVGGGQADLKMQLTVPILLVTADVDFPQTLDAIDMQAYRTFCSDSGIIKYIAEGILGAELTIDMQACQASDDRDGTTARFGVGADGISVTAEAGLKEAIDRGAIQFDVSFVQNGGPHLSISKLQRKTLTEVSDFIDSTWFRPLLQQPLTWQMLSVGTSSLAVPQGCPMRMQIAIIGDSGVGKTCLSQLLKCPPGEWCRGLGRDHPIFGCTSTMGANLAMMGLAVDKSGISRGKQFDITIWDTAGQERFHTMRALYYRNASIILVVFDVTQRDL